MDSFVYVFDSHTLDPQRRTLMHGATEVALGSRAMDLLIALVENAGGVSSRHELVSRVWPTTFVEESSLRVHVAALRRAFEKGGGRRLIVNIPGRGYCFAGAVSKVARERPVGAAASRSPIAAFALPKLIGRDSTLETVEALLARRRIVTLTGPAGVGKTSLALNLLARQEGRFAGEVHMIDLSRGGSRSVAQQVAATLGCAPSGLFPVALQHTPRLLLLDNCEHVLEDAAAFADAVAVQAPRVRLICTSREPLDVSEEHVVRLEPLEGVSEAAQTLAQALESPAAALFVERARAASDVVAFEDADVPDLRALCDLLDGVPLAIEFAAARIESLGFKGLLDRRGDLLDLLTRGRRVAAPRHRTLRGALDWSHELLDAAERRVLCSLSVFDAGFTLTSAVAVVATLEGSASIEEVVLRLVDKSLLLSCPDVGPTGDGTCFRLPNLLRCYARERLAAMSDAEGIRARHVQEVQRCSSADAQGDRVTDGRHRTDAFAPL